MEPWNRSVTFSLFALLTLVVFVSANETYEVSPTGEQFISSDDSYNVQLLLSLNRVARKQNSPYGKRVAIGWNSNVDELVNGVDTVRGAYKDLYPSDQKISRVNSRDIGLI